MRLERILAFGVAALVALSLVAPLSASSVLHMQLGDLSQRADLVFRGTVLTVEPGTVSIGGGELPTVTYRIRVDEAFKGDFDETKGVAEITMVGSLKGSDPGSGNAARQFRLPDPPDLQRGSEYLVFTTPPSSFGLATTVGLGQGAFKIFLSDERVEMAVNEIGNAGLSSTINGPVSYSELAAAIRQEVGQ